MIKSWIASNFKFLDESVFLLQFFIDESLYFCVVEEFFLMFFLFLAGLLLDYHVEFLYFSQLTGQNLMLCFY